MCVYINIHIHIGLFNHLFSLTCKISPPLKVRIRRIEDTLFTSQSWRYRFHLEYLNNHSQVNENNISDTRRPASLTASLNQSLTGRQQHQQRTVPLPETVFLRSWNKASERTPWVHHSWCILANSSGSGHFGVLTSGNKQEQFKND